MAMVFSTVFPQFGLKDCSSDNSGVKAMETLVTINGVVFAIVIAVTIYLGLDPKKQSTWLVSLYGFLTFFLVGLSKRGDFFESVILSIVLTSILVGGGTIIYRNRERAKEWLREQEKQEEEAYKKLQ